MPRPVIGLLKPPSLEPLIITKKLNKNIIQEKNFIAFQVLPVSSICNRAINFGTN